MVICGTSIIIIIILICWKLGFVGSAQQQKMLPLPYSHRRNILRFFDTLPNFIFTKSLLLIITLCLSVIISNKHGM